MRIHIIGAVNDGVNNSFQFVTEEDGDNCRGRFVGAKAVIISCVCDGAAEQVLILIYAFDKGGEENQKLSILAGGFAGLENVFATIGAK